MGWCAMWWHESCACGDSVNGGGDLRWVSVMRVAWFWERRLVLVCGVLHTTCTLLQKQLNRLRESRVLSEIVLSRSLDSPAHLIKILVRRASVWASVLVLNSRLLSMHLGFSTELDTAKVIDLVVVLM